MRHGEGWKTDKALDLQKSSKTDWMYLLYDKAVISAEKKPHKEQKNL